MSRRLSAGISLPELMISLLLSCIIIAAAIQILIITKQNYLLQQGLARIQENVRAMSYLLGDAVRSSGTIGCNAFNQEMKVSISNEIDAAAIGLDPFVGIQGVSPSALEKNPYFQAQAKKRLQINSDILWLKSVRQPRYPVKAHQILCEADCIQASFFFAGGSNPAQAGVLASVVYYIAKTLRVNGNGQPIYALYSTDLNGYTRELVEGVEQLDILYGTKKDNKIIFYAHPQITEWHLVSHVRVSALLTSLETVRNDRLLRKWVLFEWPVARFAR